MKNRRFLGELPEAEIEFTGASDKKRIQLQERMNIPNSRAEVVRG